MGDSGEQDRRPPRWTVGCRGEPVHAADRTRAELVGERRVGGERGHRVVLVVERQVVDDIAFRLGGVWAVHLLDACAHDRADLEREGRIEGLHRWHGRREDERVAVLVLQALPEQGGASSGRSHQESAGADVGCLPDEVTGSLEAEHRIEGVERNHRHAARRVAGARRDEARHRSRLGDALLEDLAVGVLGVRQQQVVVNRFVLLTLRGVDLEFPEERVHAESACFVGDDRHDASPDPLIAAEAAQQPCEAHRRADRHISGAGVHLGEGLGNRHRDRSPDRRGSTGEHAAEALAALHHVLVLDRVLRGPEVRRIVGGD